jgi:hypothetical protein
MFGIYVKNSRILDMIRRDVANKTRDPKDRQQPRACIPQDARLRVRYLRMDGSARMYSQWPAVSRDVSGVAAQRNDTGLVRKCSRTASYWPVSV